MCWNVEGEGCGHTAGRLSYRWIRGREWAIQPRRLGPRQRAAMRSEDAHLALCLPPPTPPAEALDLCFPEWKLGRNSLPQIYHPCLLVAIALLFPLPLRRMALSVAACEGSLFHFKVNRIELIGFIRLLVHAYAFSSLSPGKPFLSHLNHAGSQGEGCGVFPEGVTHLSPGKRIFS